MANTEKQPLSERTLLAIMVSSQHPLALWYEGFPKFPELAGGPGIVTDFGGSDGDRWVVHGVPLQIRTTVRLAFRLDDSIFF